MVNHPTHFLYRILKEPRKPVSGRYHRDCLLWVVYDALAQTSCRGESHVISFDNDLKPFITPRQLPIVLNDFALLMNAISHHSSLGSRNIR